MKRATEISAAAVIRAARDIGARGSWPTPTEIADHLEADEKAVRTQLRELRTERLFRDRRRNGRTVWMPWGEL